jgi:phage gp36-like protein
MFIEKSDFDASVHAEILDAITRSDEGVLVICVDRAIAEMTGYISGRYDANAIFAATGNARLQIVVMMCLDIAVYHIYCIGNPAKLSEIRKERYERAVSWLKGVQKGAVSIPGAPLVQEGEAVTGFYFHSRPKRNNHF